MTRMLYSLLLALAWRRSRGAFVDVNVFPMDSDVVLNHQTVLVEG